MARLHVSELTDIAQGRVRATVNQAQALADEVAAWRDRFRALVNQDAPDLAGNVVIRLLGTARIWHTEEGPIEYDPLVIMEARVAAARALKAASDVLLDDAQDQLEDPIGHAARMVGGHRRIANVAIDDLREKLRSVEVVLARGRER